MAIFISLAELISSRILTQSHLYLDGESINSSATHRNLRHSNATKLSLLLSRNVRSLYKSWLLNNVAASSSTNDINATINCYTVMDLPKYSPPSRPTTPASSIYSFDAAIDQLFLLHDVDDSHVESSQEIITPNSKQTSRLTASTNHSGISERRQVTPFSIEDLQETDPGKVQRMIVHISNDII